MTPAPPATRTDPARRAFSALLRAFLLIDLRGQHYGASTGAGASDRVPPLFWVFGQYLTISCLATAAMFARVDVWFFAFASLSTSIVLIMSALIVELDEAILDPGDRDIIAHRPVSPRTYAAARLTNLLAYVAMMSAALTVFPTVVGAGLSDAGPLFAPAYFLASLVASVSAAGVTVLLHTMGARLEGLRAGLAWVQIILIMVLFYGGQLMLRNADGSFELFAARPPEWTRWLPSGLLASWVAGASSAPATRHAISAAASVGVAGAIAAAAFLRLGAAYRDMHGNVARGAVIEVAPPRAGTLASRLASMLTRSRAEAAGFALTAIMLRRDADLRMRILPSLGPVAAAVVLAIGTKQAGNPFLARGTTIVLPLALIPLLAGAVPSALFALRTSRSHEAAWLLRAAPLADPGSLSAGARKAVLACVFAPFTLMIGVVLAIVWRRPLDAALFTAAAWATLSLAARLSARASLGDLPLSSPAARGAMSGSIALVSSVVSGVAGVVAGALFLASGNVTRMLAATGALVLVALVASRLGGRRG